MLKNQLMVRNFLIQKSVSLFALSVFGVHSSKKEKDVMICQLEKNLEIEVIRIL